jgi:hypothetical protein
VPRRRWFRRELLTERRMILTVGRKTPLDGKLEIPAEDAERLAAAGSPVPVWLHDSPCERRGTARVSEMACTCGRTPGGSEHRHHFLESELFRGLTPGASWTLTHRSDGTLHLHPTGG